MHNLTIECAPVALTVPVSKPSRGLDEELAARIKKEDQDALAEVFKIHSPLLRATIRQLVLNETDVDDVISHVMLELWKLIDTYDESKGKFLGWLITLTRRRSIDFCRRRQAYTRALDGMEAEKRHIEDAREPHEWQGEFTKDRHRRLNELLHSIHIPDLQRDCLMLHWFEGKSQRDIAEILNRPLGTVKTQLELGFRRIGALVVHDKAFAGDRK